MHVAVTRVSEYRTVRFMLLVAVQVPDYTGLQDQ